MYQHKAVKTHSEPTQNPPKTHPKYILNPIKTQPKTT